MAKQDRAIWADWRKARLDECWAVDDERLIGGNKPVVVIDIELPASLELFEIV